MDCSRQSKRRLNCFKSTSEGIDIRPLQRVKWATARSVTGDRRGVVVQRLVAFSKREDACGNRGEL